MNNATKVYTISPSGKGERLQAKLSTTERILQLHRALGLTPKQAYNEVQWLKVRTQSKFINY